MYHGVLYVKKIPVMCRLHSQKHLLFRLYVTTLFPEKVGAGTSGHPVEGSSIGVDGLRPAPQRNEGGLSDEDLQV